MKIGITQCAMWNSKLDEFLPAIGKAGYEVAEIMIRPEGDLTTATDADGLKKIKDTAAKAGVTIFSLAMLHLKTAIIESGDAQKQAVADIAAGLKTAKALGATSTLLTMGRLRPDLYYDDAYRNGVIGLRQVAPIAADLGIDIAIEFVWNGFLFSPIEMRRFLDEVNSPRIGFYFDPGNMAVFQLPQHWVRIVGPQTKLVHLKDWTGGALNGKWTGLLEGAVDFPAVMKELRAIGYNGPLTSEVEPNLASLEKTVEAIKKIRAM